MPTFAFEPVTPSVAIVNSELRFGVHRIYCVGRNYPDHVREMGGTQVDKGTPIFFMKPSDAVVQSGSSIGYPLATTNLHHEIELVIALGSGGSNVAIDDARQLVFGYAVGCDLTRRDLQAAAKAQGAPWDTAKGFDASAPISAILPAANTLMTDGRIWLSVNESLRQDSDLAQMIWPVAEIISLLSRLFTLRAGDLIFTGTPAGVGPLERGDRVVGGIFGVGELRFNISN